MQAADFCKLTWCYRPDQCLRQDLCTAFKVACFNLTDIQMPAENPSQLCNSVAPIGFPQGGTISFQALGTVGRQSRQSTSFQLAKTLNATGLPSERGPILVSEDACKEADLSSIATGSSRNACGVMMSAHSTVTAACELCESQNAGMLAWRCLTGIASIYLAFSAQRARGAAVICMRTAQIFDPRVHAPRAAYFLVL